MEYLDVEHTPIVPPVRSSGITVAESVLENGQVVRVAGQDADGASVCCAAMSDTIERKRTEEALRESEARMRAITDSAQDAILMMDHNGHISYWNPAAERIFGYTSDEAIGKSLHQLIAPQRYHEAHHAGFARFQLTGQGDAIDTTQEVEACHKNGHEISVEVSISALHFQDGWHSVGIMRDITKRKQAEEALHMSEAQNNAILNGITTNIALVDKELKILWANKAAANSVNKRAEDMVGHSCYSFWGDPTKPCANCPAFKAFQTGQSEHKIVRTPDGKIWDERGEPVFDTAGNVIAVVEIAQDITERKRAEDELRQARESLEATNQELQAALVREKNLARTDLLTGVGNRLRFFEFAEYEFQVAVRYHHPLSIIMLDVDHFKHINDAFGHATGDRALTLIARAAQAQLRSSDMLARYGGEEFVALLPKTDATQASIAAERICEQIAALVVETDKGNARMTVSIGIASVLSGDDSIDAVIQHADEALYAAKQAGRNRVEIGRRK